MNKPKHVADIIEVLNSAVEFYKKGIEEVDSPQIKKLFQEMIQKKEHAVSQLQPLAVAEKGEVERDGSFAVGFREKFTQLLSLFADDENTYVSQLEEVEDKILAEMREALNEEEQPQDVRNKISSVLGDMRDCHNKMRALKKSLEK